MNEKYTLCVGYHLVVGARSLSRISETVSFSVNSCIGSYWVIGILGYIFVLISVEWHDSVMGFVTELYY